ncbi:MAG: hypothetical protein JWM12_1631 [Ilumatobacteraceae bacterium]|nr:hypothetical protein [Ilumatobacteraceae bacterium]
MSASAIYDEARAWAEATWDPDMELGAWWQLLADSGWGFPTWPTRWYGRGLDHAQAKEVRRALHDVGAMGPPFGVATMMAAPMLIELGEAEHLAAWLPGIVNGTNVWCQLFSEPNAGSDLAGVQTRAMRDGDVWIVNGQKVWTSGGHYADFAILGARTDPDLPKHRGLSFFAIDMHQPGIDVRPLRQMNGLAEFNEVFLTDARVPHSDMIGGEGDGWRVALTVLSHERASVDADQETTGGVMNQVDLHAPAGSYVGSGEGAADVDPSGLPVGSRARQLVLDAVAATGTAGHPVVRQQVARVISLIQIAGYAAGQMHPSLVKNLTTRMLRQLRDLTLSIQGAGGTVLGSETLFGGVFQDAALTMPGLFIAGGSEEIQRNIIGERLLGLPGEPRVDKDIPFREVRQQTFASRT